MLYVCGMSVLIDTEAKILDWRGRTELSTVDDYRYCLLVCPTVIAIANVNR